MICCDVLSHNLLPINRKQIQGSFPDSKREEFPLPVAMIASIIQKKGTRKPIPGASRNMWTQHTWQEVLKEWAQISGTELQRTLSPDYILPNPETDLTPAAGGKSPLGARSRARQGGMLPKAM